jgi:hypothetical protein
MFSWRWYVMRTRTMLLGTVGLLLGICTMATAVNLCDYTSPETNLSDFGLSFSYRYFDDGATVGVDDSGGRAAVDFSQLYDAPSVGFTLAGSGEVLVTGLVPTSGLGEGAGTFRYYLTPEAPVFAFGGLEAAIATGQPQPGVNVRVGAGYGRFSDVTPLAKAFTIDKELRNADAISESLDSGTLIGIAEAIGRRAEYASVKDLAADVVSLIQTATGVAVPPRQVLMVEDVIRATGDERHCGWAVQGGLGYELLDPYGGSRDILVTASADAALAPDPVSQFDFRASVSGPFRIMDENTLTVRASYDRTLSETSTLAATYSLQRVQPLGLPASTSHAITLVVGFVVGKADLGLQVSLSKVPTAPAWTVDVSISASLKLF